MNAFRFIRPDGKTFEGPAPKSTDWTALVAAQPITPQTAITCWAGAELDCGMAVEWLPQKAERRRSVSAETSGRG